MSLLTSKQKKELQKLADEVLKQSELVVNDYNKTPSETSGSITHVHINSPILKRMSDEFFISNNNRIIIKCKNPK